MIEILFIHDTLSTRKVSILLIIKSKEFSFQFFLFHKTVLSKYIKIENIQLLDVKSVDIAIDFFYQKCLNISVYSLIQQFLIFKSCLFTLVM
jgi:hypothetical protein